MPALPPPARIRSRRPMSVEVVAEFAPVPRKASKTATTGIGLTPMNTIPGFYRRSSAFIGDQKKPWKTIVFLRYKSYTRFADAGRFSDISASARSRDGSMLIFVILIAQGSCDP